MKQNRYFSVDWCSESKNGFHEFSNLIIPIFDGQGRVFIQKLIACEFCNLESRICEHEIDQIEIIIPATREEPSELDYISYCKHCKIRLE